MYTRSYESSELGN